MAECGLPTTVDVWPTGKRSGSSSPHFKKWLAKVFSPYDLCIGASCTVPCFGFWKQYGIARLRASSWTRKLPMTARWKQTNWSSCWKLWATKAGSFKICQCLCNKNISNIQYQTFAATLQAITGLEATALGPVWPVMRASRAEWLSWSATAAQGPCRRSLRWSHSMKRLTLRMTQISIALNKKLILSYTIL